MEKEKILVYDGSFNGFLTSVFIAFDQKINVANIQRRNEVQKGLFTDTQTILTQVPKAKRVWNGISRRSNHAMKNIYFAFLGETAGIEQLLFSYIKKLVAKDSPNYSDSTEGLANKINHLANMVSKRKSQMEAFMQFNVSIDGIHYSLTKPEFNLLPLVSKHFRSNFGDRQWLIYDIKRSYGLYYDLHTIQLITLDLKEIVANYEALNGSFLTSAGDAIAFWNNYYAKNPIKSLISNNSHTYQLNKRPNKYRGELEAV
ncbi:MAG: TIGR03915 family putative DNA repair protein [Flavobacteriaceae bacterium]|nr:MAG: TIGR03915 family putative DNA repair protein [Flavobacteriaceae bacterium]